ncbi:MAG: ATP-binding protein [Sulfurovum sp.]|nr:ATP-binding protein [Sulfurovum sp.]
MLDTLKERQRRLVKSVENIGYRRDAYTFFNSNERLIALIGTRGVGKTTLLLQYLSQYSIDEALYFSADDIGIANFGIISIVEEFYALGGRVVVIDEIHMFKEWAGHIKNIYDFMPDMTIRISGSSMLNIIMQSHDLSRRMVVKQLHKLSFREYLEIKNNIQLQGYTYEEILQNHTTISFALTQKYPALYKSFKEYLKVGCYPYFLDGDIENYMKKLFNAIEKIIYEDIPSTNKIKFENLSIFKQLIYKVMAAKVPFTVKIDTLAKDLNISEPTLYTYLDILNKTGIFKAIHKYSSKQTRKPAKIFFKNTNILHALSIELQIIPDIGTTRETYFISCFDEIYYSDIGDFRVDDTLYEIGGKNKSFKQIKELPNSYLVLDIDSSTNSKKIPLWLFGFMSDFI